MSVKIMSVTLLLISACLCFHSCAGRTAGKRIKCCTTTATGDKTSEVTGDTYRVQPEYPRHKCVKAVIFNPTMSKKLCANPEATWVKDLIRNMTEIPW